MSIITKDFWFPHDFTDVYDMEELTGVVYAIDPASNSRKVDISLDGSIYSDINVVYNRHPWVEENLISTEGIYFFDTGDSIKVLSAGGHDPIAGINLTVVGFRDKTDKYAYTLGIVIYISSTATVPYGPSLEFTFKTGNGKTIELPFISSKDTSIQTEEEDPYSFVEEFYNPTDTGWNIFFAIPGSIRKELKDGGGLEATIKYTPDGREYDFEIEAEKFEEEKFIHYYYVNMVGEFILFNGVSEVHYLLDGAGKEIDAVINSSIPPTDPLVSPFFNYAGPSAWGNGNLYSCGHIVDLWSRTEHALEPPLNIADIKWPAWWDNWWSVENYLDFGDFWPVDGARHTSYIYKHAGFSSTILDSFSSQQAYDKEQYYRYWSNSLSAWVSGMFSDNTDQFKFSLVTRLCWDGLNLISLQRNSTNYTLYKHIGDTPIISESVEIELNETGDICWDQHGGNLIMTRDGATTNDLIYKYSGFSKSIIDSFSTPYCGLDLKGVACDADGTLYSYGKSKADSEYKIYKHDGFSSEIIDSFSGDVPSAAISLTYRTD